MFHLGLNHHELKAKLVAQNRDVNDFFEPDDRELTSKDLDPASYPDEQQQQQVDHPQPVRFFVKKCASFFVLFIRAFFSFLGGS